MESNYSYAEFLKVVGKNSSTRHAEKLLNEIYLDLFLKHIHREQIKERLLTLIDISLDGRDEQSFRLYAEKLAKADEKD
ncbi:IDEAL domain-containing protein [Filibacter tadaridae]|uniref:IDEAL domain-containing protein n=1 Tax=Filibacter tadaridae TaxID=2483811 RepID=A0A3P5WVT0_9BACL|nr:IDEAL domain-containing protein [Filibacter tadaridae]VDC25895.1 hypothetical protein FILTAD_01350 [Filibacter tadaridae]